MKITTHKLRLNLADENLQRQLRCARYALRNKYLIKQLNKILFEHLIIFHYRINYISMFLCINNNKYSNNNLSCFEFSLQTILLLGPSQYIIVYAARGIIMHFRCDP